MASKSQLKDEDGSSDDYEVIDDIGPDEEEEGDMEDGDSEKKDEDAAAADSKKGARRARGARFPTKEHPQACGECGKLFTRADALRAHTATHTGGKPYQCASCGKAYLKARYLRDHKRVHSGARPFACDQCAKAFARSHELTLHRRAHAGEQPYKCVACGKAFAQGRIKVRRASRATEKQVEKMVNYMATHKKFANSKYVGKEGRIGLNKQWSSLRVILNSIPRGAQKSVKQWQTVWRDLKFNISQRVATLWKERLAAGNESLSITPLNCLEKKIIDVIGTEYGGGTAAAAACLVTMPEQEEQELQATSEQGDVTQLEIPPEFITVEINGGEFEPAINSGRRAPRATEKQVEKMVSYMAAHKMFANSKCVGKEGRIGLNKQWESLRVILNSIPRGAQKSVKQWQTVWRDLKFNVSQRVATLRKERLATGNDRLSVPPLNCLEKRIFDVIGTEYAGGTAADLDTVPEEEQELQARLQQGDVTQLEMPPEFITVKINGGEFEHVINSVPDIPEPTSIFVMESLPGTSTETHVQHGFSPVEQFVDKESERLSGVDDTPQHARPMRAKIFQRIPEGDVQFQDERATFDAIQERQTQAIESFAESIRILAEAVRQQAENGKKINELLEKYLERK